MDSAQIQTWGSPTPEGIYTEKFVGFCSWSFELQLCENNHFFTPVKKTLACRVPRVSLATRHTTVCLGYFQKVFILGYFEYLKRAC